MHINYHRYYDFLSLTHCCLVVDCCCCYCQGHKLNLCIVSTAAFLFYILALILFSKVIRVRMRRVKSTMTLLSDDDDDDAMCVLSWKTFVVYNLNFTSSFCFSPFTVSAIELRKMNFCCCKVFCLILLFMKTNLKYESLSH